MGDLARINDAQSVDVPADRVAGLGDPPIMIFAKAHHAPFENRMQFRHEFGKLKRSVRGAVGKTSTKNAFAIY
jgi:hypothetical protein